MNVSLRQSERTEDTNRRKIRRKKQQLQTARTEFLQQQKKVTQTGFWVQRARTESWHQQKKVTQRGLWVQRTRTEWREELSYMNAHHYTFTQTNTPTPYTTILQKASRGFVSDSWAFLYLKLQQLPATSQDSGEFSFQQECRSSQNTLFYYINISQGSVATRLRWGGIFNDCFIANFLENVTVKEFWKSARIWRSYVWTT